MVCDANNLWQHFRHCSEWLSEWFLPLLMVWSQTDVVYQWRNHLVYHCVIRILFIISLWLIDMQSTLILQHRWTRENKPRYWQHYRKQDIHNTLYYRVITYINFSHVNNIEVVAFITWWQKQNTLKRSFLVFGNKYRNY